MENGESQDQPFQISSQIFSKYYSKYLSKFENCKEVTPSVNYQGSDLRPKITSVDNLKLLCSITAALLAHIISLIFFCFFILFSFRLASLSITVSRSVTILYQVMDLNEAMKGGLDQDTKSWISDNLSSSEYESHSINILKMQSEEYFCSSCSRNLEKLQFIQASFIKFGIELV